jgi:hypothetical protein
MWRSTYTSHGRFRDRCESHDSTERGVCPHCASAQRPSMSLDRCRVRCRTQGPLFICGGFGGRMGAFAAVSGEEGVGPRAWLPSTQTRNMLQARVTTKPRSHRGCWRGCAARAPMKDLLPQRDVTPEDITFSNTADLDRAREFRPAQRENKRT